MRPNDAVLEILKETAVEDILLGHPSTRANRLTVGVVKEWDDIAALDLREHTAAEARVAVLQLLQTFARRRPDFGALGDVRVFTGRGKIRNQIQKLARDVSLILSIAEDDESAVVITPTAIDHWLAKPSDEIAAIAPHRRARLRVHAPTPVHLPRGPRDRSRARDDGRERRRARARLSTRVDVRFIRVGVDVRRRPRFLVDWRWTSPLSLARAFRTRSTSTRRARAGRVFYSTSWRRTTRAWCWRRDEKRDGGGPEASRFRSEAASTDGDRPCSRRR